MEILLKLTLTSFLLFGVMLFYPTKLHWKEIPVWYGRLGAYLMAVTVGLATVYVLARFVWL